MKHVIPPHMLQRTVGALLILGVLAGCSGRTDEAAVDIEALLGGQSSAPARPTDVAVAEAQPTEELHPTAAPETDEHCIACHSNQELLTALATEAEPEESHSSGEG